jgi:hypothetical protein
MLFVGVCIQNVLSNICCMTKGMPDTHSIHIRADCASVVATESSVTDG